MGTFEPALGKVLLHKHAGGTIPVKASGAELNTGTDDAKFATAKAIKDAGISTVDHIVLTPAASKLVKFTVLEQIITTNAYRNSAVILTGWNYMEGANAINQNMSATTFGITFSVIPIVLTAVVGFKQTSAPTSIGNISLDFGNKQCIWAVCGRSIGTTGFTANIRTEAGYTFAATEFYTMSWIAIGAL